MGNGTATAKFIRTHPIAIALATGLILLILLFDWNWLRRPLEIYISNRTQRTFQISDLKVELGLNPVIRMRDLKFGNTDWGKEEHMASVKRLEFSVSLRDLVDGKILVPRVALTDADLLFERMKDGRKNWTLKPPSETAEPGRLRIGTLSVTSGRLRFIEHGIPFEITVHASTFDASKKEAAGDAEVKADNSRYAARYSFNGKYRDATFSGKALTGEVLSFQDSGVPFPIQGNLVAGTTKLQLEGVIADAANISGIDVALRISGRTMANLYPFLLLPLPASPPYEISGRLMLVGKLYSFEGIEGRIGSTDIGGNASYLERANRPLLKASLYSRLLDMADLGPLIGVQTKQARETSAITQAETSTRGGAIAAEQRRSPDRVLPAGAFEGSRLQAIDAEVSLVAEKLRAPTALPFESLRAALKLQDAVLKVDPITFGFAGGSIVSRVTMDARRQEIQSDAHIDVRRVRLERLFPSNSRLAIAGGTLGGTIDIRGRGNSIADVAAKSNGSIAMALNQARISNLLDALSGLNGGKALQLLATGDKDIAVNCGVVAFDINDGQAVSNLFVIDTEQTQILGAGGFDLDRESINLMIEPRPKKMGILSWRTPLKVVGTFRDPAIELEKPPLVARAAAVIALAAVAPLAALLPLIEPGTGEETDCTRVGHASKTSRDPATTR